jgi:succinate dehydrogenase / fumarate reductase cytochrome b subunit
LHSLSGIIPIGAFVCFHLFTNMQMLFGTFQHEVNWIHSQPAILFMEVGVLWLPIAFHAALGLLYTFTGVPNSGAYGYYANWRYTMQRITGVIALIFIFAHVAILRWRWDIAGWYTPFFSKGVTDAGVVTDLAQYSTALALSHPLILAFYILGTLSVVYHLSDGLWTAAITWGLTISTQAQKRWGGVCVGVFLALAAFTAAGIYGAVSYKASTNEQAAYRHMAASYKAGNLSLNTLEELSVTPTGTRLVTEH